MKNFYEIFEKVRTNQKWWNYYKLKSDQIQSDSDTMDSDKFIKNFIEVSGKAEISLYKAIEGLKYTVRPEHIVNTFFLGVYLYNNSRSIKEQINKATDVFRTVLSDHDEQDRFQFIWFLICLFHDLGYNVEFESNSLKSKERKQRIIEIEQEIEKLIKIRKIHGVPPLYENIITKYLKYRNTVFRCIDHGIYAGIRLFWDLCENRSIKEFSPSKLSYKFGLIEVYHYAACIILAHNIFFAKQGSFEDELYKIHDLDSLIFEPNKYRISLYKHPMFFLFCLVDTIEPIKVFKKDGELLKNIFLSYSDNNLTIRSEIKCGCHDTYFSKVKSLNDWLTPVKELDSQTLEIQL